MFIEECSTVVPSRRPFMGESRISFAPKGAFGRQFAEVFYKHFTATRFSRLAP